MFSRFIIVLLALYVASFGQIYRNYTNSDGGSEVTAITRNRKIVQEHYSDGVLRTETEVFNERRDGLMRAYYPTGVLQAEIPFKNGREHGMARFFYKSGAMHMIIEFERGKVRETTSYDESGAIIQTTEDDENSQRNYLQQDTISDDENRSITDEPLLNADGQ